MTFIQLKREIKNELVKHPNEISPKDFIRTFKSTHTNTPTGEIKSALLTLIDDDEVELTQSLSIKLYK